MLVNRWVMLIVRICFITVMIKCEETLYCVTIVLARTTVGGIRVGPAAPSMNVRYSATEAAILPFSQRRLWKCAIVYVLRAVADFQWLEIEVQWKKVPEVTVGKTKALLRSCMVKWKSGKACGSFLASLRHPLGLQKTNHWGETHCSQWRNLALVTWYPWIGENSNTTMESLAHAPYLLSPTIRSLHVFANCFRLTMSRHYLFLLLPGPLQPT